MAEWNLPERRAGIYEVVGDFYYKKHKYHESYIYYIKALEDYIRINHYRKTAWIYSLLGRVSIELKNYQEAINFNNYCTLILENHYIDDPLIMKRILFNNALAYKYLDLPDECLIYLDKLTRIYNDFNSYQYQDIWLLKGNCYLNKNDLEQAINAYKMALEAAKENNNLDMIAMVYGNMSRTFGKYFELDKSIEYNLKALEIMETTQSKFLADILLKLGKQYLTIQKYDHSEKYLLKALKIAQERNEASLMTETYSLLIGIYARTKNHDALDHLLKEFYRNQKLERSTNGLDIYIKAGFHYLDYDADKGKQIFDKIN